MPEGALDSPRVPPLAAPGSDARRGARRSANRKIGFIGHVLVYALACLLVFVVAGGLAGSIVLIAWTIAVACHGFFGVLAPRLRERWVEEELASHREGEGALRAEAEARHGRALSELSASIAHEIRNPITAAKSLVQQIAETPAAPENAEYAAVAVAELDRVERSIAHLLRFAREEPRRVTRMSLAEPVTAALALLADRLERASVRVERDLSDAGAVDGDADQLRRVFVNLVENALDALASSKTGKPRIEINAGRNLSGTECWVSVRDNGPGIPEDGREKVFLPFHTRKEKGTGLGLALCRKICEEHGGRIDVESTLGQGAEFIVTLPARREEGSL